MSNTLATLTRRGVSVALAAALVAGWGAVAHAAEKGVLTIWINGDKGYNGIIKMGEKFTKDTGIPVKVEHPEDAIAKFEQAAAAGKGPDIWIWAHDRAGSWASSGLISPVTPSKKTMDAIDPLAWSAWTMGGKVWGYPLSIESVALLYNKALVPTPPSSWEEVIELDKKLNANGKRAIMWPMTEVYYSYGLFSAGGGYAFKRNPDGSYNAKDTGMNNPGSVRGMETLMKLINAGVMPKTANYAEAEAGMNEGRVAMMINGPWSWNNLKKSKIDFGVAPFPKVDGKQGGPFVGVVGAMLSSSTPNKEIANEFLESYLLSMDGLKAMNAHVPLGVPANKAYYTELKSDPRIAGAMATAQSGTPMPNIAEMTRFWTAMSAALQNITQGRESVSNGLNRAAKRITAAD
ncbi:maltose/maltodextrin ABC transporter substrate-binding protein MalE [Curvibacter sp. CHRR-16]|uniref:maltose/maltodextrin ABC transporter substrate-binding protein MalE n=1 Tax=Curvibacter sp. CHRR-16 TaxID=2835872 RepID=UPI001BD9209C|nr:maltose/maltodextrin ABC transporter substrate-binding protein MalE [Curvibacter sp. CHRR-16]MBT0570877.1 maltose/maltodextrin ABC transporter substrate-binding protein MalE [Curvibacter sp. CHRR-16]